MGMPIDPTQQRPGPVTTVVAQTAHPCGWCMGRGSYLESVEGGLPHEYLPVVCEGCSGSGHRRA